MCQLYMLSALENMLFEQKQGRQPEANFKEIARGSLMSQKLPFSSQGPHLGGGGLGGAPTGPRLRGLRLRCLPFPPLPRP